MLKLKVKLTDSRAKLPEVAHPGEDFGFDVFACLPPEPEQPGGNGTEANGITIAPGEQKLIPVGFAAEVQDFQFSRNDQFSFAFGPYPTSIKVGLIAKQPSGLALKRSLDVKAGVIDGGYRNEIKILLYNYGKETQIIKHHDKIAQLIPMPVYTGDVEAVTELTESARGTAGWGSGHKETYIPRTPIAWLDRGRILCNYCNDVSEAAKCAVDQPCGFPEPEPIYNIKAGQRCEGCKKQL